MSGFLPTGLLPFVSVSETLVWGERSPVFTAAQLPWLKSGPPCKPLLVEGDNYISAIMAFPVGFGWGAATAAYQVEGRRRCFSLVGAVMDASGGFCVPGEEGGVLNRQKRKKDVKDTINESVSF